MQNKRIIVSNAEKVLSLFSYFTMGIMGLIWVIFAMILKKRLKFFLMYNIVQSITISLFLALFSFVINFVIKMLIAIPFSKVLGIGIKMFLQKRIFISALSFNSAEVIIFLLLIYISVGVLHSRFFYVPFFSDITKGIMRSYK